MIYHIVMCSTNISTLAISSLQRLQWIRDRNVTGTGNRAVEMNSFRSTSLEILSIFRELLLNLCKNQELRYFVLHVKPILLMSMTKSITKNIVF